MENNFGWILFRTPVNIRFWNHFWTYIDVHFVDAYDCPKVLLYLLHINYIYEKKQFQYWILAIQ